MSYGGRRSNPGDLFPPAAKDLLKGLSELPDLLRKILPMKEKHRRALAGGVRRLSGFLTVERDSLPHDYMARPEYLAAYLHYFLPWNIYRQGRLLQGLDLSVKPDAVIMDFGAGPLTFLNALWLSRPHLREHSFRYFAFDRSDPALKVGRGIFGDLSRATKHAWEVRTERQLGAARRHGPADMIVAGNFINELSPPRGAKGEETSAEEALISRWGGLLKDDAAILVIEPGTRASARQIVRLRAVALAMGWQVAAPCTHAGTCPVPGIRGSAWCHFNFTPGDIPEWLFKFSRKVGLPKERASLSFLLLTRGENPPVRHARVAQPAGDEGPVRVISEEFELPGEMRGRYGCGGRGMVLLQDRSREGFGPPPGALLRVQWPANPVRDPKSKALIVPPRQ